MEFLFLSVGLIFGGVFIFLLINGKKKAIETQLFLVKQQMEQEQLGKQELEKRIELLHEEKDSLQNKMIQGQIDFQRVSSELESQKIFHSKESEMRREQFEQQLKTVQAQFSNLATQILEQTSERLKLTNSESLEHITKPLKVNLEQLQQAIQQTNHESIKNTASLTQQLKEMSLQTEKIENSAHQLTNVIRGGNQVQGSWGERILTDILETQGYIEGVDYDIQYTLTNEKGDAVRNDDTGKRMRPDVILHYPNNEDVIIDAKMSIDAYYKYVQTTEEGLKRKYATDLVNSIRTQAKNLSKKDYSSYVQAPRKAIDFVIMFVPNEGALQLALATEPRLWGEAFEKQVFITSQQNLMAILKMIQIAWRQYTQTENQKRVFSLAEELLKRVGEFIKRFDKIDTDIINLRKHYDEAYNKAYTGRQSIVQKANELKELGVKESANQAIPATKPDLQTITNNEK
ncbi:DNA recombination protein RmuC [Hoylesella timonensis]|uniref:DNA recombination protein RmuC n=1 Tax=Hoylesella timonensis TaxID=386414 RepID=A0A2N6Q440_9BACT|nr:DNA recombination protein RmuC [Hoylesella timonensis]PMC08413.1 DNA recombination protein RmuC [Hoylesella timonensis]